MAAIELKQVVKTFGEIRAVDGLDLEVPAGICLGLLGPNGAGKSTTMKLLTAQAIADSGSLRVLGSELAKMLVMTFLGATFAGGRHARRVAKIDAAGGP